MSTGWSLCGKADVDSHRRRQLATKLELDAPVARQIMCRFSSRKIAASRERRASGRARQCASRRTHRRSCLRSSRCITAGPGGQAQGYRPYRRAVRSPPVASAGLGRNAVFIGASAPTRASPRTGLAEAACMQFARLSRMPTVCRSIASCSRTTDARRGPYSRR
jgi:hypothetical protein